MTSALWFAFAIALGTLTADLVRTLTKILWWRYLAFQINRPKNRPARNWIDYMERTYP